MEISETIWEDYFSYDEKSPSCLMWKVEVRSGRGKGHVNVTAGSFAGSKDALGRWQVGFLKKSYFVHRIIWEMHNGCIPKGLMVDHINGDNGDNGDNTLTNLRVVTNEVNMRNRVRGKNNTSGVCGVRRGSIKGTDYWVASWTSTEKRECQKWYNCEIYGDKCAFDLAVAKRKSEIEVLNVLGAGYTNRHGMEVKGG